MTGMVVFMQLTRLSLEETARTQLSRALERGWRVMVRASDPALLDRLDDALWTDPPGGFLPHGRAGGKHDAAQPVLLGQGAAANGAQAVCLLGAMAVDLAEARGMERTWLLFEGGDQAQLAQARAQWKAVTEAGLTAQYHSDESGRWEMKLEKAGTGQPG